MNITKENLIKNGYKYVEHSGRSFYVNSNGDCYTEKRIMKCKTRINCDGYLVASHNIPIHILVAKAFLKDYKPYSQEDEIKQIKKLHNLGNRPYQIIQQLYPKITRKNIEEYKLMHKKISAICKGLSYSK